MVEKNVDNELAIITLDRTDAYNALNLEVLRVLSDYLMEIATDRSVKGVIITGRGKAFCAGGDLKWAIDYSDHPDHSFRVLAGQFHVVIREIRRMPKPVIAALNGVAAGGGFSLALACDFRIMEKSASLMQAYTSRGLCIDGGGTFTLPRLVGLHRALEIAAFDQPINSDTALEWGLVTRVVADGTSQAEALEMMRTLSKRSIHSFGAVKRLFTDSFNQSFELQLEQEREALAGCSIHPDGREGLKAFVEKRRPDFQSRN